MGADVYFFEPDQREITEEQITGFRTDEAAGYYRDPYNEFSTLWKLELSWCRDVGQLLDAGRADPKDRRVPPREQGFLLSATLAYD